MKYSIIIIVALFCATALAQEHTSTLCSERTPPECGCDCYMCEDSNGKVKDCAQGKNGCDKGYTAVSYYDENEEECHTNRIIAYVLFGVLAFLVMILICLCIHFCVFDMKTCYYFCKYCCCGVFSRLYTERKQRREFNETQRLNPKNVL
jgi:hypothetical protein